MKTSSLEFYRSPNNGSSLRLKNTYRGDADNISSGELVDESGFCFTIVDGIPNFICQSHMTPLRQEDYDKVTAGDAFWLAETIKDPNFLKAEEESYYKDTLDRTQFLFDDFIWRKDVRLLEIGCGRPSVLNEFAKLGINCFGLDFARERMGYYGRQLMQQHNTQFELAQGLMTRLPFADRSLHVVFMHAALHHATPHNEEDFEWCNQYNMFDCLAEIKRVLRPDGELILSGEGVYPDGTPKEGRFLEEAAKKSGFYESHYMLSEYEEVFQAAGVNPLFFANAPNGILVLASYLNGARTEYCEYNDIVTRGGSRTLRQCLDGKGLLAQFEQRLPAWLAFK